jgi:hypothetical protein
MAVCAKNARTASLFAQELKTAIPVSRKRIEARMGEIERML